MTSPPFSDNPVTNDIIARMLTALGSGDFSKASLEALSELAVTGELDDPEKVVTALKKDGKEEPPSGDPRTRN